MSIQTNILCLLGPTAIGKTDLAIELCTKMPSDIISVDSAMVYQGMDIGTGKPSAAELSLAPHKLIDICHPSEPYNAACFVKDALEAINLSLLNGRRPILVGGTMLYFKALFEGLSPIPSASPILRSQLNQRVENEGIAALYLELQQVDALTAERLKPTDTQRIIRALEVYYQTNIPLSTFFSLHPPEVNHAYTFKCVALFPDDRSWLHKRIEERFDQMLSKGLVEETEQLVAQPNLHMDLPALRSVGYKQVIHYLNGHDTYSEMRDKAIIATRQLAKRQLTWMRQWQGLDKVFCEKPPTIESLFKSYPAMELG